MSTTDIVSTPRERAGWYLYDWANSAFPTTVVTALLGPYLTDVAKAGADANGFVSIHGIVDVKAGALWGFVTSLSVVLQVFVMPVIGAIADRTSRKRRLLAITAYTGAAATCGLMFVTADQYLLGAWLFLIANVTFGASVVVYNSFLPQIAAEPDRDKVSSRGWAVGYLGGGTLFLFNVLALLIDGGANTADVARWCLVSAGVWWAAFTTLSVAWLQDRPALEGEASGFVLTDGFKQFWRTLKGLKAYPLTIFFLVAYLVYNDGIQTVFAMAGQYGSEELGFELDALMPVILIVQFVAFGGALLMGRIAKSYGAKKTVLGSLVLWVVIVVFAYFVPEQNFGMLLAMGGGIGLVLGGSQALSRSMFSQLIPKGKEGEYFGLYEISDRGTSWMGPLLFALAFSMTESYRIAIVSLIVFFVAGFVLLLLVPLRRAIEAAGNTPPEKV